MDPAKIPWRHLGDLLVEHGVLKREELEAALAEQKRSGRRLGEIIVERGYASGPAVTRALAQQWGLEVDAEGGFGSGLWSEIERRHRERRDRESDSRRLPPEHRVIAFPSALRAVDPPTDNDAEEQHRVEQLESTLAETRQELGRLRIRLAARDQEVAALSAGRGPLSQQGPSGHVLFVPHASGYRVLEQDGAPPTVGDAVEVDGNALVVAKASRSPLPGDRRPCAYLEAPPHTD